jgi:hypothetical protein
LKLEHIIRQYLETARELAVLQKDSLRGAVKSAPATNLLKLNGIASIGGDTVEDTEKLWG